MMFRRSSKSVFLPARIAALLSLVVVVVGETVHLYQECDCCDTQCSIEQDTVTQCPFGCEHHGSESSDDTSHRQQPGHDEDSCSICFQLGQAPQESAIVEIPAMDMALSEDLAVVSEAPAATALPAAYSRGPPAGV